MLHMRFMYSFQSKLLDQSGDMNEPGTHIRRKRFKLGVDNRV